MFQVAGLSFHWYGLILGLAIAVGWLIILWQAKRHHLNSNFLENSFVWILLGGIVGARGYHVLTDWPHYQNHLIDILLIWHGGLSIIGAVIGGLLMLWFLVRNQPTERVKLGLYLDVCVFGLPIAQAIGRLGNWANQELYGLPTQLPWKLYIDPAHRLAGYENIAFYHPLFAYEAIALLIFSAALWWWDTYRQRLSLGSGRLFLMYCSYYSFVRFCLDFIRLDAARFPGIWLSINQVIMLIVLVVSLILVCKQKQNYE